jgi:hypothetical protein
MHRQYKLLSKWIGVDGWKRASTDFFLRGLLIQFTITVTLRRYLLTAYMNLRTFLVTKCGPANVC